MGPWRWLIIIAILPQVFVLTNACPSRRSPSPPPCSKKDCTYTEWSSWTNCTAKCGYVGLKKRTRKINSGASCGGSCANKIKEETSCPNRCCPIDCSYVWLSWSPCGVTCGYGNRTRKIKINSDANCGGKACPSQREEKAKCGDGRCCPVNCAVGSWGSWGSCSAACESSGQRTRSRRITTSPSCGGTGCPSTTASKSCTGGCCRRNCVMSSWSVWSKCSSSTCLYKSGTQTRSRRVTTQASCGGTCTSPTSDSQTCTPTPVPCEVTSWTSWQACVPTNGKCGGGTQKRTRRITRRNYCSPACPTTLQSRSCVHSCCPVDCQVNTWTSWSACSSTCGQGNMDRTRSVQRPPSCGGRACGGLSQSKLCTQYNDRDCQMEAWSAWSVCDNGCGTGRARKTRKVKQQPVCRGRKCGPVEAFKACTDYRNNRDCKVGQWSSWGNCDQTCAVGNKGRTRVITQNQQCRGKTCPVLKESTQCGSPNNGCQHKCTNGNCSCNAGYNLVGSKQCIAKDCGKKTLTYCAAGTQKGTTCKYAIVSCPNNQTTFPVVCSVVCPSTYALKGVSSVTCTAAASWTSAAATYCRRINDPPTQIVLSGSHSISENKPRSTLIGVVTSVDPNPRDSHKYTLISGGQGKFAVIADKLYTTVVLDYETLNKRYDLTIRSTDNGNPSLYLDKVITLTLTDVNEKPTDVQISNSQIPENSDIDTVVGVLSTIDEDNSQAHSYTLLDTASGRFKIDGKTLKVAISNADCLTKGDNFCSLNYENQRSHQITIRSTDNGNPALSINVSLTIALTDVNDQPRRLGLSGNTVRENAPNGTVIGKFSADDEDQGQSVSYYLTDNDQGRFAVSLDGNLTKVLPTDYEKSKVHRITAVVKDNGFPKKQMEKSFVIEVLDENEPPISVHLTNKGGQLLFSRDSAQVNENSTAGTVVGSLEATDNDASQNLSFNLDIDPSQSFSLEPAVCTHGKNTVCTAVMKVSGALNHEVYPYLVITVRVTDQNGSFIIRKFNISVEDNNDRPSNVTISGGLEASVAENSPGAFIGELVTSDEDRSQSHRYTLLSNSTTVFEVRRDKFLYLKDKPLDFEKINKYVVIVTSRDNGSPPMTSPAQSFTIHVTDRNEAPVAIAIGNKEVLENSPSGTIIGNFTVDDPDNFGKFPARQAHVCRLMDSARGKFQIVLKNGQNFLVQSAVFLDYERAISHKIKVLCTDPRGLSNETDFDVIVRDVNEAPIKVALSKTQVVENRRPGVVGVLTTQDPDNANNHQSKQSFRYTLRSVGSSPFAVAGNVLNTTRSLDYENARSWIVVVRAQDSGSPPLYRDESFVVDVMDGNDRPSAIQLSNVQIKENSGVDTVVGNLATSDEDSGQNHTYKLIDGAGGRFKVDGSSVKVAISNTLCLLHGNTLCLLNYEDQASYNITIRTIDNGIPAKTLDQTFTIYLNDDNDRPRDLRLTNDVVLENATLWSVIGRFAARDEDKGQKLSFSLVNDDGGTFKLNGDKLVTARTLDHETDKRHVITVAVLDNGHNALKLERNFTIEVLNINEAPIVVNFTDAQSPEVFENTTVGSVVGTLHALDSDANQDLKFTLDDDSQGEFSLQNRKCQSLVSHRNLTSCTVELILSKSLNYEIDRVRFIAVRVTDNHGLFRVQKFSIDVVDCNDAPTDITLGGGRSAVVRENSKGTLVGELETSDEDSSQNWVYHLMNDFGNLFNVTGKYIYVNEGRHLDYESKAVYILGVKSVDDGVPAYDVIRNFTIVVADINEAPTKIELSGKEIFENSSPGTVVANLAVDDPDNANTTRQYHFCVVIGQNKFRVSSGQLVSAVEFNFETTTFVDVSIECTDTGTPPLRYREDFNVSIKDMNEAPSDVILSTLSVLENKNSGVIATIATIDPDNEINAAKQSFTYQFVPLPSGDFPFKIQGNNLSTTRPLDHEVVSHWNFTLQSRDNGTPAMNVSRSFVISVQDINESPSEITLSPYIVKENPEEGTLVGKLTARDEDHGQTHRFSLLDSASGKFKLVNNSEIRIAVSNKNCLLHGGKSCLLNYETQKVFSIRVRATDDGIPPQQYIAHVNITLADANDQPRDLALSRNLVLENVPINTTVGNFTASDEDNNFSHVQNLTYSLVPGGRGLFGVDHNGRLYVANHIDHEKSSTAVVTVRVMDSGVPSKSMERQFTIIVRNANEAPLNTSFTSVAGQQSYSDDHPTIDENSFNGAIVGTLLSLDQDAGQHLTFTLDDDAGGRFAINEPSTTCHNGTSDPAVKTICSCKLVVSGSLNYENVSRHDIVVRVSDGKHSRVSYFAIEVLDQNDAPDKVTIQGSLSGRVKENANDELIGELVTSDEDVSQSHVYALKGTDARGFTVKGSKLYTSQGANLNYEEQQEFEIVVVSTDNGSRPLSVEQNLTVKIEDINESPNNITLSGLTIAENSLSGTFIANITVDDPDNHGPKGVWQTHNCQLIDSAQNRFKIPSKTNTLLVSTGNSLDHELSSSHDIIVQCTDSASRPLAVQQSFEIQVMDVNERPELIVLSNKEVPENGGPLLVGDLSTRDPDKKPVQSFKYSLVSASEENVFYITGSKLKTNASLDYEKRGSWHLIFETVDQGGLNLTQDFTISVRDTNDQPTDILTNLPLTVPENSNAGSSVVVFTAVDEDAGQTHRFFITSITAFGHGSDSIVGYQTAFELDSTSGRLIVASHIDYETVTSFNVGIMTQDSGYPQFTFNKTFILDVLDINEPPSDLQLDNSKIAENSAEGSVVGNLSVSDPDNINGDKQFYTCEVVNNVPFKVSQMQLLVADAILDFENRSDYSVKINCTQDGNSSFYIYRSIPVDVTDVNEAPYDLTILNGTSVKENQEKQTFVGTLFAADHDPRDTITFEFGHNSKTDGSSKFSINGTSLLTSVEFNYEEKSSYWISVVAKDDGTPSLNQTKQFRIGIIDVNDEPISIKFNSSGVKENAATGTVAGNFTTNDPDKNHTHKYTLLNYNFIFYIDGDELLVNDSGQLDYENKTRIQILVKTTDNGSPPKSLKQNISVKILDANDKPYDIVSKTLSVDENTQGDTSVVFKVLDQDASQSHTCSVQNSAFFEMDSTPNHSVLRVKTGAVLDYERDSTISINVSCSDDGVPPLTITKSFDITIKDVNEAPTDISLNGSYAVDEIANVGYSLGDLICADPDRNQTCSFQVIGEYDDTFTVTKNTNLLTVISNVKLDYEKLDSPVINVAVRATDDGRPKKSFTKGLNITVNEVNEGADEISLKPGHIVLNETTPVGTNISELVCNNPENWQSLDYELITNHSHSVFKIVKEPYNATYDPPILNKMGVKQRTFEQHRSFLFLNETLNYDISPKHDLLVRVTDDGRPPKSYMGNVFVNISMVDSCLPVNTCDVNANCSRIDGFRYNCTCHDGFEGDGHNCTDIDDCLNSTKYCGSNETTMSCPPCKNYATCHDRLLTFNCTCLPGFNGTQCGHNIDECDPRNFNYSCSEHSTCIDGTNYITCDCYRGFADWLCETNIDDCASWPCGTHKCIDHIGSYECDCEQGYTGSRCERSLGNEAEECRDGQYYVPLLYPLKDTPGERNTNDKESGEHESGNTDKKEVQESVGDVCFSGENLTTLYFDKELLTTLKLNQAGRHGLRDDDVIPADVIAAMRIEIEDWLKKYVRVWHTYVGTFIEGGYYNLTDVSILDDVNPDENGISVPMIARVGRKALTSRGVLCSLNLTYPLNECPKTSYPSYTSKDFSFRYYLCPSVKDVGNLNCTIPDPGPDTSALQGDDGKSVLPKWSIYFLGSLGAALFLFVVLFACFADRSQKMNLQQAMRNRQQYDHVRLPEEDDEHYRDVMFRHHISNVTQGNGEVNPIYGFNEDEDEAQMIPNPLYGMSRGIESPQTSHRSFSNPLYNTLEREPGLRAKPVGKDDINS